MVDFKFGMSSLALAAILLGYGVQNSEAKNRNYDALNAAQTQTMANLDGQRARINSKLNTAISNNQLNRAGVNSIRKQLDDNMDMQNRFLRDRLLDPMETTQLVNNLTAIENNLQAQIQSFSAAPSTIFNNSNFGGGSWNNNSFGMTLGNLNPNSDYGKMHISVINLVQKMQRQIENGKSKGTLTRSEAGQLQSQLNDIVRRDKELVRLPGSTNDIVQTRYLLQSCLDLGNKINYNINDSETTANTPNWQGGTGNGGNWNNGNNGGNWNNGKNGNNGGNWNNGNDGDGHHHHRHHND